MANIDKGKRKAVKASTGRSESSHTREAETNRQRASRFAAVSRRRVEEIQQRAVRATDKVLIFILRLLCPFDLANVSQLLRDFFVKVDPVPSAKFTDYAVQGENRADWLGDVTTFGIQKFQELYKRHAKHGDRFDVKQHSLFHKVLKAVNIFYRLSCGDAKGKERSPFKRLQDLTTEHALLMGTSSVNNSSFLFPYLVYMLRQAGYKLNMDAVINYGQTPVVQQPSLDDIAARAAKYLEDEADGYDTDGSFIDDSEQSDDYDSEQSDDDDSEQSDDADYAPPQDDDVTMDDSRNNASIMPGRSFQSDDNVPDRDNNVPQDDNVPDRENNAAQDDNVPDGDQALLQHHENNLLSQRPLSPGALSNPDSESSGHKLVRGAESLNLNVPGPSRKS